MVVPATIHCRYSKGAAIGYAESRGDTVVTPIRTSCSAVLIFPSAPDEQMLTADLADLRRLDLRKRDREIEISSPCALTCYSAVSRQSGKLTGCGNVVYLNHIADKLRATSRPNISAASGTAISILLLASLNQEQPTYLAIGPPKPT